MINKIVLAVFFIIIISQSLKLRSQTAVSLLTDIEGASSDSLTIERADGQKMIVVWP